MTGEHESSGTGIAAAGERSFGAGRLADLRIARKARLFDHPEAVGRRPMRATPTSAFVPLVRLRGPAHRAPVGLHRF